MTTDYLTEVDTQRGDKVQAHRFMPPLCLLPIDTLLGLRAMKPRDASLGT